MAVLRSRLDVILVLEQDDEARQIEFNTTVRDQLELRKRYPKIDESPADASFKLVYVAALRVKAIEAGTTFDDFVDQVLDLQIQEAPPLVPEGASQDSSQPSPEV